MKNTFIIKILSINQNIMRTLQKLFFIAILVNILNLTVYAADSISSTGNKVSLTIPQDLANTVVKTLNDEIEKRLPSDNTGTSEYEKKELVRTAVQPEDFIDTTHWEHTVTVKKIYSDAKITSLLMNTYEYMGGAHGSTSRIGLVIDNETGKRLSLGDFYITKKLTMRLSLIWQRQIVNRLEQMIGRKLTGEEKNWIRDGSNDISNYQSFVITPKMLIVYGQEYQHNGYAYGSQTLNYPRHKLADIAK